MSKKIIGVVLLVSVILVGLVTILFLKNTKKTLTNPLGNVLTGGNEKEEFVENPLTGVKVSKSEAYKVLQRRPLVVMVGNNSDARPQSNVSKADMVYEVVAEGGITRFMTVFLYNEPEKIGPIRSIRAYFLYWILELADAMVMHDGWSSSSDVEVSAVDLIDKLPVRSLFRGGLYGYRDSSREAPNNEYISAKVARSHGDSLGWQGVGKFQPWKFKEDSDKVYDTQPKASEINIVFWTPGEYESKWVYDESKNIYSKFTGGEAHMDKENGVQLSAKNVIVQFVKETAINDEKNHLLYENIGSGKGIVFLDGREIQATWVKKDQKERTLFYDLNGNELQFNRGVMWVSVVPDRNENQVVYK